ncbi:1290_t:CDS:2, partial [Entrophospora sp. SA101]
MSNITPEMSQAAEKEAARQRYWKLHKEGKTEQAKTDLARLAIIKKEREEAAMKRKAEADDRAVVNELEGVLTMQPRGTIGVVAGPYMDRFAPSALEAARTSIYD